MITRYNIGRTALYDRFKHANIKPEKEGTRSFVSGEQLKELDRLNDHLAAGRSFEDFKPLFTEQDLDLTISPNSSPNVHQGTTQQWETLVKAISKGMEKVTINIVQPKSPLWYLEQLKLAAEEEWLLTTSEVRELIGVKPYTLKGQDTYKRGCWLFVKKGKIGGQTAWLVTKENQTTQSS